MTRRKKTHQPPTGQSQAAISSTTSERTALFSWRGLIWNVIVIVLGISWMLWWFTEFTPYVQWAAVTFGVIGSVLAAFLAVAWWIVGEDRQKVLREWFADRLTSPRIAIAAALLVFLFVCLTSAIGTVRLECPEGEFQGSIARAATPAPDKHPIEKEHNYPFWIWPWSSSPIRIKIDQFPAKEVDLTPWWRSFGPDRQQVPTAFFAPLTLVAAEQSVLATVKSEACLLTITINRQKTDPVAFDGRAILVGTTDTDIPLPASLDTLSGWQELLETHRDSLLHFRSGVIPCRLRDGDQFAAEITSERDGRTIAQSNPITVRQPAERTAMITPILLRKSRQPFLNVLMFEAQTPEIKRDQTSNQPVFEPGNTKRQRIPYYQPGAVPLTARDWLRIEVDTEQEGYPYLIWVDTEGNTTPLYPWIRADWGTLPPQQDRKKRLSIPPSEDGVIPMSPGKPGVDSIILFIRNTPLTRAEQQKLEEACRRMPRKSLSTDPNYWVVLVNGKEPIGEPTRGAPLTDDEAKVEHPKGRIVKFCKELEDIFPYSRAVLMANEGKQR